MRIRPLNVFLLCLGAGALVGATLSAHYLWRAFIGMDPSAFPGGSFFQSVGRTLFPSLDVAVGGIVLALGSVLGAAFGNA